MNSHAGLSLYQMTQFFSQIFGPTYHFAYYDPEGILANKATFSVGEETPQNSMARAELVKRIASGEMEVQGTYLLATGQEDPLICNQNVFFLRNEDSSLGGLLIVSDHYEAKTKLLSELEAMLNVRSRVVVPPPVPTDSGLTTLSPSALHHLVQELLEEAEIASRDNLDPNDKMKIISELRKRGAFKLKGSVPIVAQLLNTSIPTVYRYLNKLEHGEFDDDSHIEMIRLL